MNSAELVEKFKVMTESMAQVTKDKNADYAGDSDGFKNLSMVEVFGVTSTEIGIMTRMTDKFSRLSTLVGQDRIAKVKDESIGDTLIDLANYCILLKIYLDDKGSSK